MYTLDGFIRENDTENEVKKAVVNCLVKNMTKEIAIDVLSNDLKERLYGYIYDSEEISIDGGSNVERAFTETIRDILAEYFNS